MANGKKAQTAGEHIIALYGHVTGVKRDVDHIRCTQKHIHEDIDKTAKKIDYILGLIIIALGAIAGKFFGVY